MTIKRYVAMTNREAMAQVRRDLGDDAVILSNKRVAGGRVEIVAAAPDAMQALVEDARASRTAQRSGFVPRPAAPMPGESFQEFVRRQNQAANKTAPRVRPQADVPVRSSAVAMYSDVAATTPAAAPRASERAALPPAWTWDEADEVVESAPRPTAIAAVHTRPAAVPANGETASEAPSVFRRRPVRVAGAAVATTAAAPPARACIDAAVNDAGATAAATAAAAGSAVATSPLSARPESSAPPASVPAARVIAPAAGETSTDLRTAADGAAGHAGMAALPPGVSNTVPPSTSVASATMFSPMVAPPGDPRLLAELQSLRAALQEQWVTLSSSVAAADVQRRNPLQARLMTRLLTAGFTPEVARRIALYAPESIDATGADTWLQDVLTVNLRCSAEADSITERGGVFALVGPTGVGKTTTVAKLAARFAVRHGTSALGLITLDAYRVAAHEQLRSYGRILGTPVHLAQDAATLRELLASMKNRRLVLIDTGGVGPRDARLAEMLATLALAASGAQKVQPVLLLNAASHAESLEDTARAWRAGEAAGCILTKLDEAARIGGALDCAMRHKLTLLGLTNGQRVPEDWHLANSRLLAHLALKPASQLFALADEEGALMAHTPRARHDAGAVHA